MIQPIPEDMESVYPEPVFGETVRDKLLELLGVPEIPESVEYTIEPAEKTPDGLLISEVAYPNSIGEMVPARLCMPAGVHPATLPGIVCLPGTSGSASRLTHPIFRRESTGSGSLSGWGRELARRGFATLSISVKGCDGRPDSRIRELQAKVLGPYGRTLMGIAVDEALRGAKILREQLPAGQQVGMAGMSLGGNITWYAMACAPWISAAVPVCGGLGSMTTLIQEGDLERHSAYYFVPHLLRYFDHPEIVAACIAPRPFMMIAPTLDEDMPVAGVTKLVKVVSQAYNVAGHPERFHVCRPETHHEFQIEFFEKMVKWFNRFLSAK